MRENFIAFLISLEKGKSRGTFFNDLKKPVDATIVKRAQNIFKGIENVKVCRVDAQ